MPKPKFKIVCTPELKCLTPNAKITFYAEQTNTRETSIPSGTKFKWDCHNDPSTNPWYNFDTFSGPYSRTWRDAEWDFTGNHTIVLTVTHSDGSKTKYYYTQWVDSAINVLNRHFNPRYNDSYPGPFQVLEYKKNELHLLKTIATKRPPKENQKKEHEKIVQTKTDYIAHLQTNLNGLRGYEGFAVDAIHIDTEKSQKSYLNLWLVNVSSREGEPYWILVDWTNPAYRFATGVYKDDGDDNQEAIEDVIDEWDSGNRYPEGRIKYEFKVPKYNINLTGSFDTDGKSFADRVSDWLGYVALGGAVVAGVATLIAPVPGSRVVSAAIWTSIFASTASATINIAQRHSEGFGNWKDDAFDGLTIVGNLFAGAGMAWKVGLTISSATRLGPHMTKAVLIGQISTDSVQGVLLAYDHIDKYNSIMDDPNLTPNDRMNKLLELFRSAAITGGLTYLSIKGSKSDFDNLNAGNTQLSKSDILNPKKEINLDEPPPKKKIPANTSKVKSEIATDHSKKELPATQKKEVPNKSHHKPRPNVTRAEIEAEARKAAKKLIAKANAERTAVQSDLSNLAGQHNGKMVGLEYAIKGEDSLTRKIADRTNYKAINKVGLQKAINIQVKKMNDVLRFTMTLPPSSYVNSFNQIKTTLNGKGYTFKKLWNAWVKSDGSYKGINSTFTTKNKFDFELQFHTDQSFAAKQKTHHDYEKFRLPTTPESEKAMLIDRMKKAYDDVTIPQNIEDIQ